MSLSAANWQYCSTVLCNLAVIEVWDPSLKWAHFIWFQGSISSMENSTVGLTDRFICWKVVLLKFFYSNSWNLVIFHMSRQWLNASKFSLVHWWELLFTILYQATPKSQTSSKNLFTDIRWVSNGKWIPNKLAYYI